MKRASLCFTLLYFSVGVAVRSCQPISGLCTAVYYPNSTSYIQSCICTACQHFVPVARYAYACYAPVGMKCRMKCHEVPAEHEALLGKLCALTVGPCTTHYDAAGFHTVLMPIEQHCKVKDSQQQCVNIMLLID